MEQRAKPFTHTNLAERTKRFYERVNTDREGALAELPEIFASHVHFVNPVASSTGINEFRGAWQRAFKMYKIFNFKNCVLSGDDEHFTMTYVMSNGFGIGPVFSGRYISEYKAKDGKIVWMCDYFDVVGVMLAPVPPLYSIYKWVFRFLIA